MFSFRALLSTAFSGSYSQGLIRSFLKFPGNDGKKTPPRHLPVGRERLKKVNLKEELCVVSAIVGRRSGS